MKRYIITMVLAMTAWLGISAMSYERAREEALYLTDKMAYELNLNDQQYNDAYEINLDYFMSMNTERDFYADYLSYRLTDFRYILHEWQYNLMMATDYFVRPLIWRAGGWFFPIYGYYNRGYFFYSRPAVYISYRGGHGHLHYNHGFYANRRPAWNGGFRGNDRGRIVHSSHEGGRGNGYHFSTPGRGGSSQRGGEGTYRGGDNSHRGTDGTYRRGDNPSRGNHNSGNGYHIDGDREHGNRGSQSGNSFSNSSSRQSGSYSGNRGSYSGNNRPGSGITDSGRSNYSGANRGSSFSGGSRGSSFSGGSRGSSFSGATRGGSSGGSRGGFSGGSRGGSSFSGGSRGGFSGGSHGGGRSAGASHGGR